jgi:hypothetical protein
MLSLTPQMRILVAVAPVDFRNGIDGLGGVCRRQLQEDPLGGCVFVFRNRRGTAVKILMYDGQGFWLCQKRMLALHRAGHIELPAKRRSPRNYLAERRKPATDFLLDQSPVRGPLAALRPLSIRQVRRTGEETLFNGLMERYHYLGYTQPVGEHLNLFFYSFKIRPVDNQQVMTAENSLALHLPMR